VQVHVTDPRAFRPYRTGLAVLVELWRGCRAAGFGWRPPPYEYEAERLPIHLLLGDEGIRRGIEAGADPVELEAGWASELERWEAERRPYLLYP
jgi:uncharacterized protein YbbC (DUF1343 family)